MQADHSTGRLRHHPGEPAAGLGHHLPRASHHGGQVVDRLLQLAFACPCSSTQRAAGVADHRVGIVHGRFGDVGQFPGDAPHRGLSLIALLLSP